MSKKILVVESDSTAANGHRSALEARGFEVQTTLDGKGCVELARAQKPALVILAVELAAGQNGYILCGKFKKDDELKSIPVLIVGPPEGFAQHKKLKTRADEYEAKPCDPDALVGKVAALIGWPENAPGADDDGLEMEVSDEEDALGTAESGVGHSAPAPTPPRGFAAGNKAPASNHGGALDGFASAPDEEDALLVDSVFASTDGDFTPVPRAHAIEDDEADMTVVGSASDAAFASAAEAGYDAEANPDALGYAAAPDAEVSLEGHAVEAEAGEFSMPEFPMAEDPNLTVPGADGTKLRRAADEAGRVAELEQERDAARAEAAMFQAQVEEYRRELENLHLQLEGIHQQNREEIQSLRTRLAAFDEAEARQQKVREALSYALQVMDDAEPKDEAGNPQRFEMTNRN